MSWSPLLNSEVLPGQLVLASIWKRLVDNPEAVVVGDDSVPWAKRVLVESCVTPAGTAANALLVATPAGAQLSPTPLTINELEPFYSFDYAGTAYWECPATAWYDLRAWGGGGGVGTLPGLAYSAGRRILTGSNGSYARAMAIIQAGTIMTLVVGAGGSRYTDGGASVITDDATSMSISAGGGPVFNDSFSYSFPLTGETVISGVGVIPVTQQPGVGGLYHSSSSPGFGGNASSMVGSHGMILIERASYGI